MNKEEILAMGVGRELDKLVGKMVFDIPDAQADYSPLFSQDISAAWPVVKKMFELGYAMSLLHLSSEFYPEYWYCDFRPKDSNKPPEYEWVDHQMTAPVAISKAALLARLEEIKRLEEKK